MKRARGFLEARLVAGIMVIGLLVVAFIAAINYLDRRDKRQFERGQADVMAKWNAANAKAAEDKARERAAVGRALIVADNARVAADEKAKNADQRWKEAVRESNRKGAVLAACDPPGSTEPARAVAGGGPTPEAAGSGLVAGERPRAGVPRFSPEFVRELDTAWTGLDGEPVFAAADRRDGPAGPGAPWVTAEEVRDTHGENARRCSADRRDFAALIARIKAAGAAVDKLGGAQ